MEFNNYMPVALVSENMARELWGTPAAAVGKRVHEPGPNPTWREVVGVTQDVRNDGAQFKAPSIVYFPAAMENGYGNPLYVQRPVAYTIRTDRAGTQSFLAEARAAVWSVNSNLPVFLVIVGNGLVLVGAGVVIGLAAAAGLTRLMKSLLFGVSTLDPVIYIAMPAVLIATALLASYLPARRASRIDPSQALRLE
jgi:hypothetical protein